MPKRPFSEIVDDFAMDVLSTAVKHAKTVDYMPLIKAAPLLLTLTGADPWVVDSVATADNDDVCRILDRIEQKMLTQDKPNASDVIYAHAPAPPEAGCPAAPTEDHNGEETACCGFCGSSTCYYSSGTGSDQGESAEGNDGTERDSELGDRVNTNGSGQTSSEPGTAKKI